MILALLGLLLRPYIMLVDRGGLAGVPSTRRWVSLGLRILQGYGGYGIQRWHLLMAASLMVMAPVLLLFFFAQRYFIEGITLTGVLK